MNFVKYARRAICKEFPDCKWKRLARIDDIKVRFRNLKLDYLLPVCVCDSTRHFERLQTTTSVIDYFEKCHSDTSRKSRWFENSLSFFKYIFFWQINAKKKAPACLRDPLAKKRNNIRGGKNNVVKRKNERRKSKRDMVVGWKQREGERSSQPWNSLAAWRLRWSRSLTSFPS